MAFAAVATTAALLLLAVAGAADAVSGGVELSNLRLLCEWQPPPGDDWRNVLTTVLVADTPHDSGGSAVELIFTSYNCRDGGQPAAMGNDPACYGKLRIVSGRDCRLFETLASDAANRILGAETSAVVDADRDGFLDIFAVRAMGGLLAWKWNPAARAYYRAWVATETSQTGRYRYYGLAVHDLNDDGVAEVLSGMEVFSTATGARINPGTVAPQTSAPCFIAVSDIDGDGSVETLQWGFIYEWSNQTQTWELDSAYPARLPYATALGYGFADFGSELGGPGGPFQPGVFDGEPEVVLPGAGNVSIYSLRARLLMASDSYTGYGGAPVVGHFDLDNVPEVANAAEAMVAVWSSSCALGSEPECGGVPYLLWNRSSQDISSSFTGAVGLNFQHAEEAGLAYADECFLRVYRGHDGTVLFSTARTSCTWAECPSVANVDGVPGSEILIGSNDNCDITCETVIDPHHEGIQCLNASYCEPGATCRYFPALGHGFCECATPAQCPPLYSCVNTHNTRVGETFYTCCARAAANLTGVRVYHDPKGAIGDSRPLWNMHAYSISNILDDQTVPRTSEWKQPYSQRPRNRQGWSSSNTLRVNGPLCWPTCRNGGTCVNLDTCSCPREWTGDVCEIPVTHTSSTVTSSVAPSSTTSTVPPPSTVSTSATATARSTRSSSSRSSSSPRRGSSSISSSSSSNPGRTATWTIGVPSTSDSTPPAQSEVSVASLLHLHHLFLLL